MTSLYEAYDATRLHPLAEINPFVLTKDGEVLALDAKITFDDNALFRHPGTRGTARSERRRSAGSRGLPLRASITSSSTATSAAWSTAPASPWPPWTSSSSPAASRPTSSMSAAASRRAGQEAFRILLSDHHVKAVLINIFGGIVRCDTVASGVVGGPRTRLQGAARRAARRHQRRTRTQDPDRSPASISPRRRTSTTRRRKSSGRAVTGAPARK